MTVEQMAIAGLFGVLVTFGGGAMKYLMREIEKRDAALLRQSTIIEQLAAQVPEMAKKLAQSEGP